MEYEKNYNFIFSDVSSERGGKGNAIRRVLTSNKYNINDIVLLMDADNSISIENVLLHIDKINSNDILIFNRYNNKNKIPFLRSILGKTFNIMVKGILNLRINDTQTGYKVFKKRAIINEINKVNTGNTFFDVSLLYHANKSRYKIKEISAEYKYNENTSFHIFRLTFNMFLSLFAFKFRHSKLYNKIPYKSKNRLIEIYYKHIKI